MNYNTNENNLRTWSTLAILSTFIVFATLFYSQFSHDPPKDEMQRGNLAIIDDYIQSSLDSSTDYEFGFIGNNGEKLRLITKLYTISSNGDVYKHQIKPCAIILNRLNVPYFRFQRYGSKLIVDSITSVNEISKNNALELVATCSEGVNKIMKKYKSTRTANISSWKEA